MKKLKKLQKLEKLNYLIPGPWLPLSNSRLGRRTPRPGAQELNNLVFLVLVVFLVFLIPGLAPGPGSLGSQGQARN